jgi:hypothetical protein
VAGKKDVTPCEDGAPIGRPVTLTLHQLDLIKRAISGPQTAKGPKRSYWRIRQLAALEGCYRDYARNELRKGIRPMPEAAFWEQRIIGPTDPDESITEAISLFRSEDYEGRLPKPEKKLLRYAMRNAVKAYAHWPEFFTAAQLDYLIWRDHEAAKQRLAERQTAAWLEPDAPAEDSLSGERSEPPGAPVQPKQGRRLGVGTLAAVEALVHYAYHHGDPKDTPIFLDELMDYAQANELPHSADLDRRSLGSLLTVVVNALKVPDRQPG